MMPKAQHAAVLLGAVVGLTACGTPVGIAAAVAAGLWLLVVIA